MSARHGSSVTAGWPASQAAAMKLAPFRKLPILSIQLASFGNLQLVELTSPRFGRSHGWA